MIYKQHTKIINHFTLLNSFASQSVPYFLKHCFISFLLHLSDKIKQSLFTMSSLLIFIYYIT